ncbi:MAG: LPS-assembly protein LptD [Acidobacteria bacterium]|nr:LPS-assembly protein LptD [Acidobacteriota bacterium]
MWLLLPLISTSIWLQDVQVTITTKENRRLPDGRFIYEPYFKMESPNLFLLTADRAEYDPQQQTVIADGNIKIDYTASMGLVEIAAQHAVFDLGSQTGFFEDVSVQLGNELFFVGNRLDILSRDQLQITRGVLTACNQPINHWSLKIGSARVKREGYALVKNASFRIMNIPLLYFPAMWLPAFQERRSGILVPETGASDRNGIYAGVPFYWAPRDDFDVTLTPYVLEKAGMRADALFRYAPTHDMSGFLEGQYMRDGVIGDADTKPTEAGEQISENRYRLHGSHRQKAWGGQMVLRLDEGSDFQVDRDYLVDTERTRVRDYNAYAGFSKRIGLMSLQLDLQQNRRILSDVDRISEIRFLPSVRLIQPETHLGAGFYLNHRSYMDQVRFVDLGPDALNDDAWRLGLETEVSRANHLGRYLHSRYGLGYRGVLFEGSESGSRNRKGGYAFATVMGPRLGRQLKGKDRGFAHLIDYGVTVQYGEEDPERLFRGIQIHELDLRLDRQLMSGLQGSWFVQSRVFVGSSGVMLPYLQVDLSQQLFEGSDQQPIELAFRLGDNKGYYLNGLVEYDLERDVFATTTMYGTVKRGKFSGYMGYVRRDLTDVMQDSLLAATDLRLLQSRVHIRVIFDYDFSISDFKSREIQFNYNGACLGSVFRFIQTPFTSDVEADRQWLQLGITLRNLGELGFRL